MKDRIFEVMKMVGMNPTDFANAIEISPAVLSSIKSGRTKPTLFLVEKIKSVYPNVNINWLITGEGEMLTDTNDTILQQQEEFTSIHLSNEQTRVNENQKVSEPDVAKRYENKQLNNNQELWQVKTMIKPDDRKISQIIVLYTDGTFESLMK